MESKYNPRETEDKIYKFWEDNNYFHAEVDKNKKPFTIVIPPPNVTGKLHMGHAFDDTLQDILIRTKRMQGYSALWLPGTDHAGIATQVKVEEELRKNEGLSRYDLGRDKFLERVWEWKHTYGSSIINQLKKLGASCDWERERFTMDEGCSKAVREVFVRLYDKGLIYKGNRIINWCPKCITALSDAEVEHCEKDSHLWHINYKIDGMDEYITVATTRPETMLGDTGIAVHPDDDRYKHLIGKNVVLPLINRLIPIFADEYVDMEFGTGCVKITPCHDPNDFLMGQRNNLEEILILDNYGKINKNGGKYQGQDRFVARNNIIKDLEELGALAKIDAHKHNVGHCYRCNTIVEPMTSVQWFVKMEPLAKDAISVVENGDIKFVPDRFSKTYTNWMNNVHDWCISRQLWWGHRIPAFYCLDCEHTNVSREDVTTCSKCSSTNISQDEDVLDTWFSSALWPFSTLGWPDKTPELEYFYPTNVLVTGYDIIFFWVARMIFSSMEHMGGKPFDTVFIHGIVRDSEGRKMSKSLGNGIDPLEVIEKYGADALRFTLATGNSPGNDTRFYEQRTEANRNFANKIWNATRFALMYIDIKEIKLPTDLLLEDKWILSEFNTLVREVTENIDKYELGIAASKIYDFIWDKLCDWYIEIIKPRLQNTKDINAQNVLCYVLSETMKLLHPFMPFITETIWQALPHSGDSIMVAAFPVYNEELNFSTGDMSIIIDIIRAIRNRRSSMNIPPSKKAMLYIDTAHKDIIMNAKDFITKLSYSSDISFDKTSEKTVSIATESATINIPLGDLIDFEAEKLRLEKELKKALDDKEFVMKKLNNPGFRAKASAEVIKLEEEKASKINELINNIEESIKSL